MYTRRVLDCMFRIQKGGNQADKQKFVTIHRNGSAGINRYYSRHFDPYVIYDELKYVSATSDILVEGNKLIADRRTTLHLTRLKSE
jgi:hypothetical protein